MKRMLSASITVQFFDLDVPGKSHTKKDRTKVIDKLVDLFEKEKVAEHRPGRQFKGPIVSPDLEKDFDEALFLSWHYNKTKELVKFYKYKENFSSK